MLFHFLFLVFVRPRGTSQFWTRPSIDIISPCLPPAPSWARHPRAGLKAACPHVSLASAFVLTRFPSESPLGWVLGWALGLMGQSFPS